MIGKVLAHYEIIQLLGKGGMGEVFLARDTKLGREVAVKLLPREVASDSERLARFQREAKLLATLNHPAIASLYGIEESDDHVFLVMELAEGEDLSKRIQRGAMPVDEALTVALHIAEALEAAHAKNIVHRDLKPANVIYAPGGRVKLLDFGLARAYHGEETGGDPMASPTITAAMTLKGTILGTAAYMSPEQARGKPVDRQADIWAFGVVLYEMLTAHRLFRGETVSDSIGAILHKDPEWERLPTDTPPQIRQLLTQCLERDCGERLHDIADARVAILDAKRDPSGSRFGFRGAGSSQQKGLKSIIAVFAAVTGLMAGMAVGPKLFPEHAPRPYRIFEIGGDVLPSAIQGVGIQAAVSPDGSAVVYTHDGQLWLQGLDQHLPIALAQTEDAIAPFWSPDGTEIGWFKGNRILKAPARGGRPVALCEFKGRTGGGIGAFWGEDGRILFSQGSSGINTVSELGGQITELIEPGDGYGDLHEPFGLPDDRGILFVSHPEDRGPSVLEIWRDGERRVLFEAPKGSRIWYPCYDKLGYILFRLTRSDATAGLWAMAFDSKSSEARGEPFLVEPDASEATIDRNGDLVFVMNPHRSDRRAVVQMGFDGKRKDVILPMGAGQIRYWLSPDGQRLAFTTQSVDGGTDNQLWMKDLTRDIEYQLPVNPEWSVWEMYWSPDNKYLYLVCGPSSDPQPYTLKIPADGSASGTILSESPGLVTPGDDQLLVVTGLGGLTLMDDKSDTTEFWLQSIDDPDSRRFVLGGDGLYFPDHFSPSGHYLLYWINRGDEEACYLTRFPEFTGRWKVSQGNQVSSTGFAPDGSAIYYVSGNELFRVAFEGGATPVLGRPERVSTLPGQAAGIMQIHPDGKSYITTVDALDQEGAENKRRIKIVQNWTAKID